MSGGIWEAVGDLQGLVIAGKNPLEEMDTGWWPWVWEALQVVRVPVLVPGLPAETEAKKSAWP